MRPIAFLGAALVALSASARGETPLSWRVYKLADGLPESACVSVTVSPAGRVLTTHPAAGFVSELDGYGVALVPSAPEGKARVYESPSGQLWTVGPEGLLEYRDGEWVPHPVPEIAVHRHASATPVLLCPVRRGLVLWLVPEGLWQFNGEDPGHTRIERLRAADERLGKFTGMTLARDGGLWLAAEHGLAKAAGLVRNLKPETEWADHLAGEAVQVHDLHEPHADAEGGVTVVAASTEEGEPVIARLVGQTWTRHATGGKPIAHAWTGPEGILWATTTDALWRWDQARAELVRTEEISFRHCADVAVDPGGTFWLATSDGLFRYTRLTWRCPSGIEKINSAIRCLTSDQQGRLWFLAGPALYSYQDDRFQEFSSLIAGSPAFTGAQILFPLKDGTLLIGGETRSTRFDPATAKTTPLNVPYARALTPLGWLRDGVVCLQAASSPNPTQSKVLLFAFDGKDLTALPDPPVRAALGANLSTCIAARNGDLWLGSDQATAWYHDKRWRVFESKDKTAPEAAVAFAELADGKIWCAAPDKLWEFDGRDWSAVRSGFDRINALQRTRDSSVWVASSAGLYRFFQGAWIENSLGEGLPDANIHTLHEDLPGRLWAGTARGLSLFHPDADLDPPQTYLQAVAESDRNIPEGGGITLRFAAQDKWKHTPRERLLYAYRLDEREWSPFQEVNGVSFADLPAGKHYFQVRSLDRNGNLDPKPAQFEFVVLEPWYREGRLLAIAVAGLAVALFFAGLAWNRHRQLVRSYAAIEHKVAERTRELELAHRELLHSQKMNALGTLAAGIAHDFNNILSIIKGSAQIIEANLDQPQKVRTRVDRIKTVVEQGSGIVKAMLGFSRDSEHPAGPCEVNSVVEDTLKLLGDRFLREVQVRFEPAAALPAAAASKDFIQQILLNFIFNAAEALRDRKQIILTTRLMAELPGNPVLAPVSAPRWVAIAVQDFGSGIPPEILRRIFEPFFTTKSLSARRGTGLGLSMVYELARKMGAGLVVESTPNVGSTFSLILAVSGPAETKIP